jgi:hypothetical protein
MGKDRHKATPRLTKAQQARVKACVKEARGAAAGVGNAAAVATGIASSVGSTAVIAPPWAKELLLLLKEQQQPAQARSPRPIHLARKYLQDPTVFPRGFAELTTPEVQTKICDEHVKRGGAPDFFKYDTTERACGRDKRKRR